MTQENIQTVALKDQARERYLIYALSVITSRAIPDVRDGLKPVQRRILYTMFNDLRLTFDGRPRKCAKIVGDVTGNYHPHGTTAAYEALVRLAQDFVMRVPLVVGQGNFGSVDGDAPAAERYTEAKLALAAESLMSELRQGTVEMRPNYDNTREEPVVVPAQFPNLLVNGASGIAVGLATNIPPHNLGEVIRAAVFVIENPQATTSLILDRLKGPDFPLGGKILIDRPSLTKIYEEGSGSLKVQGQWKVESPGKKDQIVVYSIPYSVDKGKLISDIGLIVSEKKLPLLTNVVDESSEKEGIRIVLELKPEADPALAMAYLYKHTQLQDNFACNFTCLIPVKDEQGRERTRPERLGVKAILRQFLDFRFKTVKKRFEFDLEQLRKRIHILKGFKIIFDALDRAIRMIRESDGKADAAEKLMQAFKLDQMQVDAILDAQLYKIAHLEIRKILEELREKAKAAHEIEEILGSIRKLWGVVKSELNDLAEKFPDKRRTRFGDSDEAPEFDPEAYIIKENTNVVLTRDGWFKRVGRLASVEGTRMREGDEVISVVPGSTLDLVVLFSDDGTAYTTRINEVSASSGYGEPAAKYFRLGDQTKLIGLATTDERFVPPSKHSKNDEPVPPFLLALTAMGQVLRTPMAPFRLPSTKSGRMFARLNEGDRVIMVAVLYKEKSLLLASKFGHVIHFAIEEINILSGPGKGVMGIKLADDDLCLGGMAVADKNDTLQVQTSTGKTMDFRAGKYEIVSRGGRGFPAVKRSEFVRVIPPPIPLVNWDEILELENGKNHAGQKSFFE
ncbi:MAG: DNA topoisomerase 4 subunit A [Gemmataceae bacterium]|nr:DNA topoisomerase 4 subunit A [Gemmataceae bacterium]